MPVAPITLYDFVHAADHRDGSIAGYLEPGARSPDASHRFVHWRSSNPMLPAFVNCLEGGGDMRRIHTNHERAPWVRPRGPGVKRRDNLRPGHGDGALVIEPVPMTSRHWPARVTVPDGPAPLPGGLHAAAARSSARSTRTAGHRDERDVPSLIHALEHYTLATRTLIEKSAASGFAGVHDHVGALLVGDDGAILAAGINTGSYRHAEVSLLLSWFRDHPEARALPPKSIVLSTLTPCRQCTRYLSLAMAPDTLVRFDEADAGRSGRVGERIAEPLGARTDRRPGSAPEANATRGAERRAIRNAGRSGVSRIDRARDARRRPSSAPPRRARRGTRPPWRRTSRAGHATRNASPERRTRIEPTPAFSRAAPPTRRRPRSRRRAPRASAAPRTSSAG